MRSSGARLLAATLLCLGSAVVWAVDYTVGSVRVVDPFSAPTPPGVRVGAVWLASVINDGAQPDRLLRAASPVAGRVEMHALRIEDGVARMRELDAIELAPGRRVQMRPQAGEHLMLLELKRPLKAGDRFPLTLEFERAGRIEVDVQVQAHGASAAHGSSASHGAHGGAATHGAPATHERRH